MTWGNIDSALSKGRRGLPGGTSLSRLLAEHRGRPDVTTPLTVDRILAWADAYFCGPRSLAHRRCGPIADAPSMTWGSIDSALSKGRRGVPGGTSLGRLLAPHRGRPEVTTPLTVDQILAWADAHFAAHGRWPTAAAGPIADAPSMTWGNIDTALTKGRRGLPGGTTLSRLLAPHRGRPEVTIPLTVDQILGLGRRVLFGPRSLAHRQGRPRRRCASMTWRSIDTALTKGLCGLPGGTTLSRLLALHRGRPEVTAPLTVDQILAWADAHFAVHGRWPTGKSGPVSGAAQHDLGASTGH